MNERIDLHLHSTCSDGSFTPEEVVRKASDMALSVISLTDHDSMEGVSEAQEVGKELGIEVVPGVELSAQSDAKDIHILGYFVDPANPEFRISLQNFREERIRRAERIVVKLNSLGIRIQMAQVLSKAGSAAVGRPHVADVMVEEGFVFSANEAFNKYLGYAKPAYQGKHSLSPLEAISQIHSAGGLASLAHPVLYSKDSLIPDLVEMGLDGIEVMHTKHRPSEVRRYTELADRYGLLPTGGSDCHGDSRGNSVMGKVKVPMEIVERLRSAHKERSEKQLEA